MGLERRYLLDSLARSLAMLSPGAPALDREQAMRLVADLEEAERRLDQLIGDLGETEATASVRSGLNAGARKPCRRPSTDPGAWVRT